MKSELEKLDENIRLQEIFVDLDTDYQPRLDRLLNRRKEVLRDILIDKILGDNNQEGDVKINI